MSQQVFNFLPKLSAIRVTEISVFVLWLVFFVYQKSYSASAVEKNVDFKKLWKLQSVSLNFERMSWQGCDGRCDGIRHSDRDADRATKVGDDRDVR